MTIPEMLEWVGIYCGWPPPHILSVIADTGVNLNSLYVHRPRKENVFKNIRGNETFCGYVTSKPSNTYHAYISFIMVEKCMSTGQETKKKKKEDEEEDDDDDDDDDNVDCDSWKMY